MEGWIKLHRSLLNHRHYKQKRTFSEYEAWIDMILLANYTDKVVDVEGNQVQVKRGSFLTSQKKLADRWQWDKRKVVSFLKDAESENEIRVLTEKRWTIISVRNYEKYQGNAVEIEIKSVPTFAPTLCTDFSPVNTGVSEVQCTDLMHRSMHTTKEYIKNNKEILSLLSDIIDYLNEKAGKKYRKTVAKTNGFIKARLKEGFSLDDFKAVIDVKVAEWKDDAKMNQYLRPETLFGNKFESYLNQAPKREETNPLPVFTLSQEEREYYERINK